MSLSSWSGSPWPPLTEIWGRLAWRGRWQVLLLSACAVGIPVFIQAPLVRSAPWVSLVWTLVWLGLGCHWLTCPRLRLRGELLYGFALTWLTGSLYWGWLRWEPAWHLPVEALALPLALWGLWRGWAPIGQAFYLGSLTGTVITDLYVWLVDLTPVWRAVMAPEAGESMLIAQWLPVILGQIQSLSGILWGIELALVLLIAGLWGLYQGSLPAYAWSGAVLSTLLVDGLFLLSCCLGV
ncbi:MAG: DUF3120 domain-containing protein [Thermostichales cyanobacterium SZTDM-1c_bins_54]